MSTVQAHAEEYDEGVVRLKPQNLIVNLPLAEKA